jgi:competence protein ComEC
MLAAAYVACAIARHARPERALGLSLLVGALVDPLLAFDVSFLLSAAATVGLVTLGRRFSELTARVGFAPLRWLASSAATTLSAMLPCAPLLAVLSPELTLVGVLANVVAAPIGEAVALPLCLAHPVLAAVPFLGEGVALVGSGALGWVRGVAHLAASVQVLSFDTPPPGEWHFVVMAVSLLGAWLRPPRGRWALGGVLALGLVELAAVRAGRPSGELRVTLLDIGQGDSLLVDLPDGALMLVDAGGSVGGPVDPGARVVAPVLRARRRARVDVVVLSHPHPDHFGGLSAALERVEVGELWDSGQGEREGAGPELAALFAKLRARGTRILRPRELCESPRRFGQATVRVLGPCPDIVPGRHANDNSVVLALELGQRRALLLGDAERKQEQELVERQGSSLRADFLKVGHHGSRTSSTAPLLAAVRPTHAGISCGVRNRFGHPHVETQRALAALAIHMLRTDRHGAVTWATDGDVVRVGVTVPSPD